MGSANLIFLKFLIFFYNFWRTILQVGRASQVHQVGLTQVGGGTSEADYVFPLILTLKIRVPNSVMGTSATPSQDPEPGPELNIQPT